jgi:cobalt/nickel transport system ATP-binding protein
VREVLRTRTRGWRTAARSRHAKRKRLIAMSHIHIPDGVLPVWLVALGWLGALALVWYAARRARASDVRRKVPLLGVVSALVLVAMSTEIVPIAYHLNLTVVAGVLLGPWLGAIAAFIVIVILALLGHGGITVIGLNTLMIATEMALGWAMFRLLVRLLGRRRVPWAAAISTVLTLAMTTTLLVGLVALAGPGTAIGRDTGALDPRTLTFANPFGGGVVSVETLRGAEPAPSASGAPLSVARFATVVYTLGPIGWVIEALVTAGILGYVARVRPQLVAGATRWREIRRRIGVVLQNVDEQLISPTVFDDVAFSPRQYGLPESEVRELTGSALALLGIADLANRAPHNLSGGEKRKVALAGALVLEPELLVLDEPFEGLDPASRASITGLLARLSADRRTTVVMSTHDIDSVPEFADYAYVLQQGGRIIVKGTPAEIFARPEAIASGNIRPPLLADLFARLREQDPTVPPAGLTVADAAAALKAWKGHGDETG